jgi:hypothetical protein
MALGLNITGLSWFSAKQMRLGGWNVPADSSDTAHAKSRVCRGGQLTP